MARGSRQSTPRSAKGKDNISSRTTRDSGKPLVSPAWNKSAEQEARASKRRKSNQSIPVASTPSGSGLNANGPEGQGVFMVEATGEKVQLLQSLGRAWKLVQYLDGSKAGEQDKIRSTLRKCDEDHDQPPSPQEKHEPAAPEDPEQLRCEIAALQAELRRLNHAEEFWTAVAQKPSEFARAIAVPESEPVELELSGCLTNSTRRATQELVHKTSMLQVSLCSAFKLCDEACPQ
eukprot:TRINITY_DN9611_c0_g1_i6.p1 TRINITY_DN9611_c0_g1~~TRINITY_DN9611_c0_g1_i6.p1  ORF type:complete len:233 (-),score=58.75 TRINITY_DN9611_c0_g1_i6:509-1207(-)